MEAGADGFLAKDASSRQVAGAIRKLVDGQGRVAVAEVVARPVRDPSVDLRVRTLSGREREILGLLANGWSNRRIAEECFLSLNTVRTHVQNVLVKLGVHSRLEAIVFAFEQGLVLPRTDSAVVTLMPSTAAGTAWLAQSTLVSRSRLGGSRRKILPPWRDSGQEHGARATPPVRMASKARLRWPPTAARTAGPPRTQTGRSINRARRTARPGRTIPRGGSSTRPPGLSPYVAQRGFRTDH
jgi:DNA-binding CsgD family transcriptional regulator